MNLRVALVGTLIAIIGLGALLFTAIRAADVSAYRQLMIGQVKAATGRDLTISGPVQVEFGLPPRLRARDVSFKNAAWGSQPQLATIEEIEAELELLPLLLGDIRIVSLSARGGKAVIERSEERLGNWVLDLPSNGAGNPAQLMPAIEHTTLRGFDVVVKTSPTGEPVQLRIARLEVGRGSTSGLALSMTGALNDNPFELTGQVSSARQFMRGPIRIAASGKIIGIKFNVTGEIGEAERARKLSLNLDAKGKSLSVLGMVLGIELPESEAFDAKARLADAEDGLLLDPVALQVGHSDLAGSLAIKTSGDRMGLNGDLQSSVLNGADFAPATMFVPPVGADISGPRAFLPFPDLDFDVQWRADAVTLGNGELRDLAFTAKQDASKLDVEASTFVAGKAESLTAKLAIAPDGEKANLALRAQATNADVGALLAMLGLEPVLSAVDTDIELDVKATASSWRELPSRIDGKLDFTTGPGEIITDMERNLYSELLPDEDGEEAQPYSCLAGVFDVSEGRAISKAIILDMPESVLVASGAIEFARQSLDMNVVARSKGLTGILPSRPLAVRGMWAAPIISSANDTEPAGEKLLTEALQSLTEGDGGGEEGGARCAGALKRVLKTTTIEPHEQPGRTASTSPSYE